MLVDAASSLCTQFGAAAAPATAVGPGMPCVTTWDTVRPAKNAVKKDNAFEAKCRKIFDAGFDETSQPGVPAGDITDAGGHRRSSRTSRRTSARWSICSCRP